MIRIVLAAFLLALLSTARANILLSPPPSGGPPPTFTACTTGFIAGDPNQLGAGATLISQGPSC